MRPDQASLSTEFQAREYLLSCLIHLRFERGRGPLNDSPGTGASRELTESDDNPN